MASRRKWLSLLLDTDNEKVAAAYQKYDQLHKANVEAANKGNAATMPKSGAIGPVKPITPEELSAMSNIEIAAYLKGYTEEDIGMHVLEGRGLANTLTARLLPLAEEILLILVDKAQQSVSTLDNLPTDILNSDRGRVFSAIVNYALRFARTNASEYVDCRWPYAIRADFTKRLDRSIESSLEFSYTLGFYLPYLSYLDEEWVRLNINHIFPQRDEDHWQAAFSGYLLPPNVREEFYLLLKAHGHYRKALNTHFDDPEVLNGLVRHICTGWIEDSESLGDKTSLIYQLIHSGNPNLLSAMVYFFSRRADNLSDKVKVKVIPAWRALFQVLSENMTVGTYQEVSCPLLGWLGLVDTIDTEVLGWVKGSIEDIDKVPGYGMVLSRLIKALLRHAPKTSEAVGEIYLKIPQRIVWDLQVEADDIKETVRILYNKGHKDIADKICNRFGSAGVDFLRTVYQDYQR